MTLNSSADQNGVKLLFAIPKQRKTIVLPPATVWSDVKLRAMFHMTWNEDP